MKLEENEQKEILMSFCKDEIREMFKWDEENIYLIINEFSSMEEIGLDSLDVTELVMSIEASYNIAIDDNVLSHCGSLDEFVDYCLEFFV